MYLALSPLSRVACNYIKRLESFELIIKNTPPEVYLGPLVKGTAGTQKENFSNSSGSNTTLLLSQQASAHLRESFVSCAHNSVSISPFASIFLSQHSCILCLINKYRMPAMCQELSKDLAYGSKQERQGPLLTEEDKIHLLTMKEKGR